jgi:hypothetical protein
MSTMKLDFGSLTEFSVANEDGKITSKTFSFSDEWELIVVQMLMKNEQLVQLANVQYDNFYLVKTKKDVGKTIDEDDSIFYVDEDNGLIVMNVIVTLDPKPNPDKPQTKLAFDMFERNDRVFITQDKNIILSFIEENYEALTVVGSGTRGMPLNNVTMVKPPAKDEDVELSQSSIINNDSFLTLNRKALTNEININKIIHLQEIKNRVSPNFDNAIKKFKQSIPLELNDKMKIDIARHIKDEDIPEFTKLYEASYNALITELESKELFDENEIKSELDDELISVIKDMIKKTNVQIFSSTSSYWNLMVQTVSKQIDHANPDLTDYKDPDSFMKNMIQFYMENIENYLKDTNDKLMEYQITTWMKKVVLAFTEALKASPLNSKDEEYIDIMKTIIGVAIENALYFYMKYDFIWSMISSSIEAYAHQVVADWYQSWMLQNTGFLTDGFRLDYFMYLARQKNAVVLFNSKYTSGITAVYDTDGRLLI